MCACPQGTSVPATTGEIASSYVRRWQPSLVGRSGDTTAVGDGEEAEGEDDGDADGEESDESASASLSSSPPTTSQRYQRAPSAHAASEGRNQAQDSSERMARLSSAPRNRSNALEHRR